MVGVAQADTNMKRSQCTIAPRQLSPDQIDELEDRFYQFNAARTGHRDYAQLAFVAEVAGSAVGAVAGFTWGGYCELRQLWVDEDHRANGVGHGLLTKAIEEARNRGCAAIYLATYSFQAPGFYKRFGFEPVVEIENRPVGHSDFIMRLALQQGQPKPLGAGVTKTGALHE